MGSRSSQLPTVTSDHALIHRGVWKMPAEEGCDDPYAGEADEPHQPTRCRLTLAPTPQDEVLVEDVNEDEASDSDSSSGQGELSLSKTHFHSTLLAGLEVEDAIEASLLGGSPYEL
jgi:hypothetical protein